MPCKITVNTWSKYPAVCLVLQISVPSDMVGIGMRIINCFQLPVVCIQNLPNFTPGIFIISAVNQADIGMIKPEKPDFCRAFNIAAILREAYQLIHLKSAPLLYFGSSLIPAV